MNPKLEAVKTALDKVDSISARKRELETEQKALQGKIQKLTARVADGDVKAINDLAIASARSAHGVPSDLAAVKAEFDPAIHALRQTLLPLQGMVAKAYSAERNRVEGIIKDFIKTLITDPAMSHNVELITRQLVEAADTVKPLDYLNSRFSATHINPQHLSPESTIARARDAIANLADVA